MRLAIAAVAAFWVATAGDVGACSLVPIFQDGGRYVGGDLPQQIAREAYAIQLVRARRGIVVGRAPTGTFEAEPGEAVYSVTFEIVENLADRTPLPFRLLGWSRATTPIFVRAYDRQPSVPTPDGYRTQDRVEVWLPSDALDHPGSENGYYQLRAPIPAQLSDSSCAWAMGIDDGELFLALRDQSGSLYAFDFVGSERGGQLSVRYTYSPDQRAVQIGGAPPLIRVTGHSDPIYARVRAALRAQNRLIE